MPPLKEPFSLPPDGKDEVHTGRVTAIEILAVVLSAIWLLGSGFFFLLQGSDQQSAAGTLQFVVVMIAVFLPVAMIWVGATAARASRIMREESQRLHTAISALRQSYVTQSQAVMRSSEPSVSQKLDAIVAAQRKTETALAIFSTVRAGQPEPRAVMAPAKEIETLEDQVALPLGTPVEDLQLPLARKDLIRALNFPETPDDKEGFAALRLALKDRTAAQLIRAAQDVLTLLSHDGIYMDDLRPDMARPEIWRRFASGERGRAVAALGGIRDRSSLALTAARMKQDTVFRDAVHHFLRLFDRMFTQFAEAASDADLSDLSETRTARAFMLLGRVAGTFD